MPLLVVLALCSAGSLLAALLIGSVPLSASRESDVTAIPFPASPVPTLDQAPVARFSCAIPVALTRRLPQVTLVKFPAT